MSGRWALFVASGLLACSVQSPEAPAGPPKSVHPKPAPSAGPAASTTSSEAPAAPGDYPPADRVFFDGGVVYGADGDALWAQSASPGAPLLWRVSGEGVVTHLVSGRVGKDVGLFVVRGLGRGHLEAALTLSLIDPKTGLGRELFRHRGERNEAMTVAVADVDRDGVDDLAFSYFASKYFVRTRHLTAKGGEIEGPDIRMASSRVYPDLDGDGRRDEVLGRVYGDAKELPGDLRIDLGRGFEPVLTQGGVKSMLVMPMPGGKRDEVFFCDGWVANYGKEARARLKRLRYVGGKSKVDEVGASSSEFTFFSLSAIDTDGDGEPEIVAQGDKQVTVFRRSESAPFEARVVGQIDAVLNTAVGRTANGEAVVFVPGRASVTTIPLRSQ